MSQFITLGQLTAMLGTVGARQVTRIGQAVTVAGIETQNLARTVAPVDTGALRASISVDTPTFDGASVSIEVGPEVNYGAFVEFGTSRASAQPYMIPAADQVTPRLEKALADLDAL
jgi:HK97 gp10 family phage protein